jgi:hypothetical protein
MSAARFITVTLALGVFLATSVAQAQPEVEQQVNAIFNTWKQAAAAAKASGQPAEAKLSSRMQERLPVIDQSPGSKNYPLFTPRREPIMFEHSLNKGNFSPVRNFAKRFTGPATLAVTADGRLATRSYKGHDWGQFSYTKHSRVISIHKGRNTKIDYAKGVKPLVPKIFAKMFPKTAKRIGDYRAKRMIRQAVKAGRAPSALNVKLSFHRAARK